jgi:hypothetical protein
LLHHSMLWRLKNFETISQIICQTDQSAGFVALEFLVNFAIERFSLSKLNGIAPVIASQ